eukprot:scaffold80746_cov54-Phaeocystis_antarctica.AAC.2
MPHISVTFDVSKLSGWLKTDVSCRESKRGHTMRNEVRAGRREAAGDGAAHAACMGGLDCRLGAGHGGKSAPRTEIVGRARAERT